MFSFRLRPARRTESASDEALMRRVQDADRAAFEALYARHKGPLFQFLLRRTGSRALADEAHQEAWLRVYRFAARFDGRRRFRPWLYRIAINTGTDAIQREPSIFSLPPDVAAPRDPIALRNALVLALGELSALDRRILLLSFEGFTSEEVGDIVELSAGAVRKRLCLGRRTIQTFLRENSV